MTLLRYSKQDEYTKAVKMDCCRKVNMYCRALQTMTLNLVYGGVRNITLMLKERRIFFKNPTLSKVLGGGDGDGDGDSKSVSLIIHLSIKYTACPCQYIYMCQHIHIYIYTHTKRATQIRYHCNK